MSPVTNVSKKVCSVPGCALSNKIIKSLCTKHYQRMRIHGDVTINTKHTDMSDSDRFDLYVEQIPFSECWLWSGSSLGKYGGFSVKNKTVLAHRFQYERYYGKIPSGLQVRHTCNNGHLGCVSPDHMILGTLHDNIQDRVNADRTCKGEDSHYAKLSANQVRTIRLLVLTGMFQKDIAARYNVYPTTIQKVCKRMTWKHI